MNCVNHPETPVASYCQNCGKALCSECTRPVGGFIYCEQCLAAKVGAPSAQPGAPFPPGVPVSSGGANPALATILGIIPGVGAMYNGQFVKAMIHVLVFVILIAITDQHDFFGFFIAAWVLYQIFDANQTAKARRDGLPLPDPFGINELANRLGNPKFRRPDLQEWLPGTYRLRDTLLRLHIRLRQMRQPPRSWEEVIHRTPRPAPRMSHPRRAQTIRRPRRFPICRPFRKQLGAMSRLERSS